ncbi:MAG TPA: hypothetical protein DIS79_07115 [Bacteroidetes bacterium]|nr:hypothetical protein [Bacteroidota bacterium]
MSCGVAVSVIRSRSLRLQRTTSVVAFGKRSATDSTSSEAPSATITSSTWRELSERSRQVRSPSTINTPCSRRSRAVRRSRSSFRTLCGSRRSEGYSTSQRYHENEA